MGILTEELIVDSVLDSAFEHVKSKRMDHHSNADIWHLAFHWEIEKKKIQSDIQNDTYIYEPLRYFYSEEAKMHIGIWSARDAVVIKALTMVLEKRAKRVLGLKTVTHLKGHGGLKRAVRCAKAFMTKGRFVLKTDIADYYESIDHEILIEKIKKLTNEPPIIQLVLGYCQRVEYSKGEYRFNTKKGIPRGCSLSSLISAIYLHDIDQYAKKSRLRYVRYQDDIFVVSPKRYRLKKFKKHLYVLCAKLRLQISKPKTCMTIREKGTAFLGYFINQQTLEISQKTLEARDLKKSKLIEQGATISRIAEYEDNWLRWAVGALAILCLSTVTMVTQHIWDVTGQRL